jgi:hypothetical protein
MELLLLPVDAVPVFLSTVVLPSAVPFSQMSAPIFPNVIFPDVAAMVRVVVMLPMTVFPAVSESVPDDPSVIVFDDVVMSPFVSVSVPLTVTAPPRLIPFARLSVRLFSVTAGSVVLAPDPPKEIFDVAPPVRLPLVVEIAPLSVSVLAPIESTPLVSVSVPLAAKPPPSETTLLPPPPVLATVKSFTVAGRPLPTAWFALPL